MAGREFIAAIMVIKYNLTLIFNIQNNTILMYKDIVTTLTNNQCEKMSKLK